MKVMMIPILNGDFGTVIKGLEKSRKELEIRERIEAIQTTALLRSAWMLGRVLEN